MTPRFRDALGAELTKIATLPGPWLAAALALVTSPSGRFAAGYAFAAAAVLATGSEFGGGQARVSLLAVPDRRRLFYAKLAAVAACSLPAVAVVAPPAAAAAYVLLALLGHALALVLRGPTAALSVLLVTGFLVTPLLRGPFPALVRCLPPDAWAAAAAIRAGGLAVLAAWTVALLAAARARNFRDR